VIDHGGDLAVLVKRLKEKHSRTYNKIAVDYVATKEVVSIF